MRRAWAAVLVFIALAAMAVPAGAAKKPPPADNTAQAMCEYIRLLAVNQQYGIDPSSSDYSLLIQGLDESRSKGAAALHKQLFAAPTPAAQAAVLTKVAQWCANTLKLRCSAATCLGGNQVATIPKKR